MDPAHHKQVFGVPHSSVDASRGSSEVAAQRLIIKGDRSDEVVRFERTVIALFLDVADLFGFPKSLAAIYGICFANARPLTFADIGERVMISRGSLSQGLRLLKQIGALKVVGVYERREYFTPDMELRKLFARLISQKVDKQIEEGGGKIRLIEGAVPRDSGDSSAVIADRIGCLRNWHRQASSIVPLLKIMFPPV